MKDEIEKRVDDFFAGKVSNGKHKPFRTVRILILEDDLEAMAALTKEFAEMEKASNDFDIALTVLSEYTQVEEYINKTEMEFDVILLDRDCKSCGSFHILDFEKFSPEKIISISSIPDWNKEAEKRGVKRVVLKELDNIGLFAQQVAGEVLIIINIG